MWNIIFRHRLIYSFVFVFVFSFIYCFGLPQNTFADVQDVSYTIDSSTPTSIYLCGSSSGVNCSDYRYIYFERNFSTPHSGYIQFRYPYYGGNNYPVFALTSPSMLLEFDSYQNGFYFMIVANSSLQSDESITVTFTNTNPYLSSISGTLNITENGTYDVTNYASAVVDVSFSGSDVPSESECDYHDDLAAINQSIIIGVATLLVIYFFYCIYRMLLRGRV